MFCTKSNLIKKNYTCFILGELDTVIKSILTKMAEKLFKLRKKSDQAAIIVI